VRSHEQTSRGGLISGRRAFLGIAAVSAAAVAVPSIAHASGILSRVSGPAGPDWTALAHDLAGTLVRPGDAAYATARLLFDPRFDGQRPAGIAYVKNNHDVATCLAFVRKYKIPVAARSGGHSYAGWSGTSGLIIDISDLKGVRMSGTSAIVGAGTRLIDFYNGLAAHGRAVPGGSCPTVGIAGLTLGGGIGVTARAHGLTCDNLEAVEIVTASGAVLTATAAEHADLYWACRGGGGGNFGVATWFTFATTPAPAPVVFFLSWPWSQAARVIAAWQAWAPHAPDALWSNLHLAAVPGGSVPSVRVGGTYLGSIGGAANQLDELYVRVGSHPSGYFLNQFSEALQDVSGAAGGGGGVAFDALGGAVNRIAPGATAFVHRNALFDAQYTTGWATGAATAGINRQHTWLRDYWSSMRPYASGQAYQNYIDPDLTNWRQAY
jgi:FAD/FMN-containing dehydrogenase